MYQRWPKRDPNKHYYFVPNEVFNLGLSSHEIAVYNYLLRCEDRRTYQCHPSYRTIGKAVQLSENTVRKYVAGLEEKGLIHTEPSTITTKDGRVRNGSLIYTIRPIREALELNYQRQFQQAERDMERAKAEKRLAELNRQNKKKEEESA
jgi:predicted transcriptional regulator